MLSRINLKMQKFVEAERLVEAQSVSSNGVNEKAFRAKLPQLKITPFDGNSLKWQGVFGRF